MVYVLLWLLSWAGAVAWHSLFLWVFGSVWLFMAVVWVLWFLFMPVEEDDARPAG